METQVETQVEKSSKQTTTEEIKIFIIDDDPIYCQALKYQLKKTPNYKIYSFNTGEECIKNISLNPDIFILDYRLNDSNLKAMNGLEILKRIKLIKPEASILMLSGQDNFTVAANSIKHGAFDYIVKNESAFIRVEHLIKKILDNIKFQKISNMQQKYYITLIIVSIFVIVTPGFLHYFRANNIFWIFLFLYLGYFLFFLAINKIIFINQRKMSL